MNFQEIMSMFEINLSIQYLDVLIHKETAELLLDEGFKIMKLGACNYEVYRRIN